MATTRRQRQIQASLDEVQHLLKEVSGTAIDANKTIKEREEEIKKEREAWHKGLRSLSKFVNNSGGKVTVKALKNKFGKEKWFSIWYREHYGKKEPSDKDIVREADLYKSSKAAKGISFLKDIASSEGSLIDFFGAKIAEKTGDWLQSKLPKSVQEYLEQNNEDEDEDEDELDLDEEKDLKEVAEEDILSEQEASEADIIVETKSKAMDDVVKKFKEEPGPKHVDELVSVLTDYTEAAKKLTEENKRKEEERAAAKKKQEEDLAVKKKKEKELESLLSQEIEH